MATPLTLLIVDGCAIDRQRYRNLLRGDEQYTYTIAECADGRSALEWCQSNHADVILINQLLPDVNGLELLKGLKQQSQEAILPVAILAAQSRTQLIVEALHQGAQNFLETSQLTAENLCQCVYYVLEQTHLKRNRSCTGDRAESDRAESEEKLRHSEEKFRQLADNIDDVFWMSNADTTEILYINPAYETIWGRSCESLYARPISFIEGIHPDDQAYVLNNLKDNSTTRFEIEYRVLQPDGTIRWVMDKSFPVQSASGEISRRCGIVRDITRLKQAEEQLRESNELLEQRVKEQTAEIQSREQLLNDFFEAASTANIGLCILDRNLRYLKINQALADINGHSIERHIGSYLTEIIPELVDSLEPKLKELLITHEPIVDLEVAGIRPDQPDRIRYWLVSYFPIYSNTNRVDAIGCIVLEISDRKQAEDRLRESEARFRSAFDDAAIGMAIVAIEGAWMRVNPSLCEMLGYTQEEFLQTDCQTLSHPDDLQRDLEYMARLLNNEIRTYQIEKRYIHQQGYYVAAILSVSLVRDTSGNPLYFVSQIEDISDLKAAEHQLQQLNHQLQRSNEELEQFAFIASHDLKEPLRTIRNFSNLLQLTCENVLNETAKDHLSRIDRATRRMQSLIDDLLQISQVTPQTTLLTSVDLNQVVEKSLANLSEQIQRTGGQVLVEPLPTIQADATQMAQLFQNLISNALKFHSDRPPLVKIYAVSDSTLQNSNTKETDSMIQLFVEDNGVGFDPKYRDRIFNAFERLHGRGQYEGTGMGLSICKKIVEQHGGVIEASSILGQGSTFILSLPVKSS